MGMTNMDIIKAELQNLQKVLEDKANIYLGPGRTKLLSFANACGGALKLLKAKDINVPTKWVSVKDRLPENDRFVLVCNDDGHMLVAQYIEETAQWQYKYTNYDVDLWDDEEQGPVCWWAELPKPPKEGDGE